MKNKEFDKYVSKYDMNNYKIELKYKHTYRVVDYCIKIADSLNLNERDKNVAKLCGLLHDITRFKQAEEYDTFNDWMSFDHGDMGYEILKENDYISNYIDNEEDKNIILKAVKLHNKKYLEDNLTEREKLFCEIIRDADKLDIMDYFGKEINDESTHFSKKAYEEFKNKKLLTYQNVDNDCTEVLKVLAFIFDLNFKESFNQIKIHNLLENKYKVLENHVVEEELQVVKNIVNNFIEEKLKND